MNSEISMSDEKPMFSGDYDIRETGKKKGQNEGSWYILLPKDQLKKRGLKKGDIIKIEAWPSDINKKE